MTLHVHGLRKAYKKVEALKELSFQLPEGGSVALLGPNGAGKSTAIKVLVTLLPPDSGEFLYHGENLFEKPARIRDLLGYVSQEIALDKMLTGEEFMRFCAGIMHLDWRTHKARAMELLEKMGLGEAKGRQVGEYSGGMKRRLDLASALLHDPKVLVLDEPTTGLDIEARETIWALIKGFLNDGGSLILASHDFREVGELSQNVLILQDGRVIRQGSPDQLKQELGRYILRIKTREFMSGEAFTAVREAFSAWGERVVWQDDDEHAVLIYRGEEPMNVLQNQIYDHMAAKGLNVHTLNIHRPDLEDVYRFATGGAQ